MSEFEAKRSAGRPATKTEVEMAEPISTTATFDLTQTPEFKDAVAKAAQEAASAAVLEILAKNRDIVPQGGQNTDLSFIMENLAMKISDLTDQGHGRAQRVAPEVLQARSKAHERMIKLIVDAFDSGEKPEYRVIAKTWLKEQLIEPFAVDPKSKEQIPVKIVWEFIPNHAMSPINAIAKAIFAEFQEYTDGVARLGRAAPGKNLPSAQSFSVTPNGQVVSTPINRRAVVGGTQLGEPLLVSLDADLTEIIANDPRAKFLHVLGSALPPATRNNASAQYPLSDSK